MREATLLQLQLVQLVIFKALLLALVYQVAVLLVQLQYLTLQAQGISTSHQVVHLVRFLRIHLLVLLFGQTPQVAVQKQ